MQKKKEKLREKKAKEGFWENPFSAEISCEGPARNLLSMDMGQRKKKGEEDEREEEGEG